jgi:hypothetical protein
MKRRAEYEGWFIDAAPLKRAKDTMFQACVVIESVYGRRFVFTDFGYCATRSEAHELGIEWAKRWIDNYDIVSR